MNIHDTESLPSLEEMLLQLKDNSPRQAPLAASVTPLQTAANSPERPQVESAPAGTTPAEAEPETPSAQFSQNQANSSLLPNLPMAQCHLNYLDPNAKGYFFMAIKDKGYTKSWVNKAFNAVQDELIHYNQQGYGIYVTVNEIDSSGHRKAENVTRIRAVFEDNDTPHAVPVLYPLQPSFEVESSPGKFHRYWLVKDEMTQDTFKSVAKSLIQLCQSDPVCKDAPRVLRLAGFYHHKKRPVMTILREAIYDLSNQTFLRYQPLGMAIQPGEGPQVIKYTGKQLTTEFPPLAQDRDESPLCFDYSSLCLAEEEPKIYGAVLALSNDSSILNGYDTWIRCGMAIHSALPDGVGLALWKFACAKVPNYDEAEMDAKWAGLSGYGYTVGTLYYLAQQAGWQYQECQPPGSWPRLAFDKKPLGLTTEARDGWRLAQHLGNRLVYTQGLGWFSFDGVKLNPEKELENSPIVVNALPRIILKESERCHQKARELLKKHALRLEYNEGLAAAIKASQAHLKIQDHELDRHLDLFCCQNGVVNLVTGQLRPGKVTDFITQQGNAHYLGLDAPDPPLFVEQMNWLFDDDPEVIRFVQKWLGYSLSGRVNEHLFPEFIGEGGSGKSKLFEAVMQVFGDYGDQINPEVFHDTSSTLSLESIMKFRGKRLVYAAETKEKGVLNEQFIKSVIGNDQMNGRVLYVGLVTFKATHKLMLITNFKTIVAGKDHSIWRRLINIQLTERRLVRDDTERGEKIKAEANQILSWLVRGFQLYLKEGLERPAKLVAENEAFRGEMNLLQRFIEEQCCIDQNDTANFILKSDLIKGYQLWLKDEGYDTIRPTRNTVENEMKRMGYEDYKGHRGRVWRSVVLTSDKLRAIFTHLKNQAGEERAAHCGIGTPAG